MSPTESKRLLSEWNFRWNTRRASISRGQPFIGHYETHLLEEVQDWADNLGVQVYKGLIRSRDYVDTNESFYFQKIDEPVATTAAPTQIPTADQRIDGDTVPTDNDLCIEGEEFDEVTGLEAFAANFSTTWRAIITTIAGSHNPIIDVVVSPSHVTKPMATKSVRDMAKAQGKTSDVHPVMSKKLYPVEHVLWGEVSHGVIS